LLTFDELHAGGQHHHAVLDFSRIAHS
jgi:hypothetical protein